MLGRTALKLSRSVALMMLGLLQACASLNGGPSDSLVLEDGTVFEGEAADNGVVQQALLAQFKDWRGTPYKLGGNSRDGIDCSAFVQRTLSAQFQLSSPRTTIQQMQMGQEVDRGSIQVGDLLFFRTGFTTRHVGFYLGKGQFLHASTTVGITISRLGDDYWKRSFFKARRVL